MRESGGPSAVSRFVLVLLLAVAGMAGLVEEKPVFSVPVTAEPGGLDSVVPACNEAGGSGGQFCCKGGPGDCGIAGRPVTMEHT